MNFSPIEIVDIRKAFNVNGYVLNFSDETFAAFNMKSVNIDIQKKYGGSKCVSLMKFFEDSSIDMRIRVKLLTDLIDRYKSYIYIHKDDINRNPNFQNQESRAKAIEKCKKIVAKYSSFLSSIDTQQLSEEGLREIIESANRYYVSDIQTALEKTWDAFERIKTMFDGNKKSSSQKLIEKISNNDENHINILNEEFNNLTKLGNDFRIRHSETNKINIISDEFRQYLFNRCMALINLAIKYIDK